MSPVSLAAAVRLNEVSVTYETRSGERIRGIEKVSWSLPIGSTSAVIGRSGSGKSTLMSVLSLMRRQTEGEVEVLGHVASALTSRQAARLRSTSIGVVFQSFHLDQRQPLWWNIALPWVFSGGCSLRTARRRAEEILERIGLEGMATRCAGDLSGGQRQRVAIGRALMSAPALFIADEPTGNLDEDTADSVSNLIFGLTEQPGVTVIVVTHDHEVARRADHVVHLANGQLSAATEPLLGPAR